LARPYLAPLIATTTHEWFKNLLGAAEAVTIAEPVIACRDPTDDKFLELAVNGRADLIVSGDADLLALHPFRSIPIVSPATFVQGATR
jgi:putative PIN family toxin of toxin-antitoxin system